MLGTQPAAAVTYTVSDANWGTSATTNSMVWALAQANANPGPDRISIMPCLAIHVDGAMPGSGGWLATISDALSIEGHGATLTGNPRFVSSGGTDLHQNQGRCLHTAAAGQRHPDPTGVVFRQIGSRDFHHHQRAQQ